MHSTFQLALFLSYLFANAQALSVRAADSTLAPRQQHAYDELHFGNLEDFMNNQNAVNWTDNGDKGRLAFINDDLWDQAQNEMASTGYKLKTREVNTTQLAYRQETEGSGQVTEDNGDQANTNWFCRKGLGGSLIRGLTTVTVCDGMAQALKAGYTGRWFWQGDVGGAEDGSARRVAGAITMHAAEVALVTGCVNVVVFVVGEYGCPPSARRDIEYLESRQEPAGPNLPELTGGGVVEVYAVDGGAHLATFDIGTFPA